jgi:Raf kinase inhibitor-like YbhB/YbcL family protein
MKLGSALFCAGLALAPSVACALDLHSSDFVEGSALPLAQVFTDCGGENVSPALSWNNAPRGTRSFALTIFDPDAKPSGWWHWIMVDIPPSERAMNRGSLPTGAMGLTNDFGDTRYDGPCPPIGSGTHRYIFTFWALPVTHAPLEATSKGPVTLAWLSSHALAKAELTGFYRR